MSDNLREAALDYHRYPTPGKISVNPTKPMATQRDLALAYSPGVAAACEAIIADPAAAPADKAYALYRAVNCYGPSGNNSCGGVEVPPAQRKAWFLRLKKDYPTTSWARDQRYFW